VQQTDRLAAVAACQLLTSITPGPLLGLQHNVQKVQLVVPGFVTCQGSSWQGCFNALGSLYWQVLNGDQCSTLPFSLSRMAFMQVLAVMLSTMTVSQSPPARKALPASHHKAALSAARPLSQSFHMLRYKSFAMHLCGGHHYVHLHCISEPM